MATERQKRATFSILLPPKWLMAFLSSRAWCNKVSVFTSQNKQAHKSLWFGTAGTILHKNPTLLCYTAGISALNAATDTRCGDGLLLSGNLAAVCLYCKGKKQTITARVVLNLSPWGVLDCAFLPARACTLVFVAVFFPFSCWMKLTWPSVSGSTHSLPQVQVAFQKRHNCFPFSRAWNSFKKIRHLIYFGVWVGKTSFD